MKRFILSLSIFLITNIYSQQVDTTKAINILELKTKVDSLSKVIIRLDNEIRQLKENAVTDESKPKDIIELLTTEETETMPEDQRSKKKRVDDLLRAIEQRPGVLRFNGGATASFQSGLKKNYNNTNSVGSFDIYALTSFGKGTLLFFDIEAIGGNGVDEYISTFSGLNGDAGSLQDEDGTDRLHMLEAWGEFTILDELFTITAGKIDLTNYFDNNAIANDETLQFLANAFVNSNALAVPANSPGIRFRTSILNRFYIQFGLASVDNSGSDLFNDLFKIAGIGFRVLPDTDWEANFRLYGYQHPNAHDEIGYGISFDETIFGEYKIFARYGKNSDELSKWYGITSSWSTGLSFVKNIQDWGVNIGLAYGETEAENSLLHNEKLAEIYARYQFNKWVYLSPHLQLVWNANGTTENYSVLGIRTHFNF